MSLQNPNYTSQRIPNGKLGVAATLNAMRRMVKRAKKSRNIRELAMRIVQPIPNKDWAGEIRAIQQWVQHNIRYTRDIAGVETLQSPEHTVRLRAGDCDDHAMLVAALLQSIYHPARFRAIGKTHNSFCHVYVETKIANKWFSVETTEPVNLGWLPGGIKSSMLRHM